MEKVKKVLKHIFIDGLTGMAGGLFSTLIIGLILMQIGGFISNRLGEIIIIIGKIASGLTGAGIRNRCCN